MTTKTRPTLTEIRAAKADNPKLRERDLAQRLGISEAEYIAAHIGAEGDFSVRRITPVIRELLDEMPKLGEVMALTRNESAVHETIGIYDRFMASDGAAAVFGENINLRLFFKHWAHGFAVEKRDGETVRRSLQFFDQGGEALQKIHLRPATNLEAYEALVQHFLSEDQSPEIQVVPYQPSEQDLVTVETFTRQKELRERWDALSDVHEFFPMLRDLGVSRYVALRSIGEKRAWMLAGDAVTTALEHIVAAELPIMCFVANRGCTQIYGGPVATLKPMGPWLNIMDPSFNLHLRTDHIAEVWAVRRPIKEGYLTSLEAFNADGEMIIQFFGTRQMGHDEPADWRALVDALPRAPQSKVA